MKPFNLQDALAGKPVVTRDGRPATHLVSFPQAKTYTVVAVVDSELNTYTSTGKYVDNKEEYHNDLFMASTKVTKWVNLYRNSKYLKTSNDDVAVGTLIFDTEQEARQGYTGGDDRVATVLVEWEE